MWWWLNLLYVKHLPCQIQAVSMISMAAAGNKFAVMICGESRKQLQKKA